ncbi:MAG: hypothetical protein NTV42_09715 [Chloroflexi bacterium]|nr:hypothetical protein [Chloroflexota bacterium]
MELSSWRDIILIIWGIVATVAMVFISVILYLFYRKTISVLDSTDLMVAKVGNIANYVEKEVVGSISRFGMMIQGIIQGISIFGSIFNKKEDQDD